jgi:hypothetical protein
MFIKLLKNKLAYYICGPIKLGKTLFIVPLEVPTAGLRMHEPFSTLHYFV